MVRISATRRGCSWKTLVACEGIEAVVYAQSETLTSLTRRGRQALGTLVSWVRLKLTKR